MSPNEVAGFINRRRRQILVHSFLYYRLNENIIDDHTYDLWSKELAELQIQYPEIAAQCIYAHEFINFDGSSGYDLPMGEPWVQDIAARLLRTRGAEL